MKSGLIKKADIILAAVLLILGFGSMAFAYAPSGNDLSLYISVEGKEYKTLSLDEDISLDIDSEYGHNRLVISDGKAWVEDADCRGKDCMGFGKISKEGQMIVCLPHKLMIQVIGMEAIDAVNY